MQNFNMINRIIPTIYTIISIHKNVQYLPLISIFTASKIKLLKTFLGEGQTYICALKVHIYYFVF